MRPVRQGVQEWRGQLVSFAGAWFERVRTGDPKFECEPDRLNSQFDGREEPPQKSAIFQSSNGLVLPPSLQSARSFIMRGRDCFVLALESP